MEASFWRSDPAAELRGLTKRRWPASSCRRFSSSNAATGMYTSPRTSSTSGAPAARRLGTTAMVATFAVTSSPTWPSPRVAACTSRPRS